MLSDVDGLLSIGEFSARCGLSAKMLRSYAAAGLLKPAAVDHFSGYRYYSAGQLRQAHLIALLRQAGIAVTDIAEFVDQPDLDVVDRWEREVATDSIARRNALAQARTALAEHDGCPTPPFTHSTKGSGMNMNAASGVATAVGIRDVNQDGALVGEDLFAVADGFGRGGELASQVALETLRAGFSADRSVAGLLAACQEANRAVWLQADTQDEGATMGTTLTALAITSDVGVVVVHVGDSRLYRARRGRLDQLTIDHTVVDDLMRAGELSEEEAKGHPHRQILLRALGVAPTVDLDYAGVSCQPGDRLLLCTDGLFRTLVVDELVAALRPDLEPQQSADDLVSAAVEHSAQDNVTAVILDV
ncbi:MULTISPECIES: MerR family transcriptional regulator [unclassified Mycobacterium]|uniref:MerR family transcriptional regulator n=1 Tax=unclassified Mycobacterium TaxID=2642494 RepID=UPI0029C8EDDC|nr:MULTISPECIES: MerR family transcriptional regulator [unclassified Mycobacterium]